MVIDFHTHAFPDKIAQKTVDILAQKSGAVSHTNGTVAGLLAKLEESHTVIGVALPVVTKPSQFDSINRFAAAINEQYTKQNPSIISFGGIHPACEDLAGKMRFLKESGFLGIKIHPDYQDTFIDDAGYLEILSLAKELDMIVVTHAGVDEGYPDQPVRCTPSRIRKVIETVRHDKFVLAHFGGNRFTEQVYEELAGLDVYFDTSFVLPNLGEANFKKILSKHGEDKILFATDCPWRDIKDQIEIIRSYGLKKETEEKILYRNAAKLLGLQENI